MSEWTIALGALVLTLAISVGSLLARVGAAGTGNHRGQPPGEETVSLAELLRPQEAMVNDLGWCPAERRERLHAFLATGGRVCWTCRTFTPHGLLTSTPPQGGGL